MGARTLYVYLDLKAFYHSPRFRKICEKKREKEIVGVRFACLSRERYLFVGVCAYAAAALTSLISSIHKRIHFNIRLYSSLASAQTM